MENKNLILRCFIYFLISFLTIFLVLDYFRQDSLKSVIQKYEDETLKNYNKYFQELNSTAEFIFFNEFINDKKLTKVFQNSGKKLSEELYDNFEPHFAYYKTLGLYDISFYSADNQRILNFQDMNFQDNFVKNLVQKVIETKKELFDLKTNLTDSYVVFSKPIIDEKLNLVAVINMEFDFNIILTKLNQSSKLNYKKETSKHFDIMEENIKNMVISIPVFESNNNKIFLEIDNLKNNEDIKEIDSFYDYLLIAVMFILAIFFYLIYQVRLLKTKKDFIKSKYDELFSQIDNYVLKLDTDLNGNITFVTKYFCKISGYSKDEILGKNANVLRHPDMSSNFYKNLWNDLKTIKIWQGEIKNRDKFGNTYWVKTTLFPIYDSKNEHIGYSSIRTEISSTKQLEKTNRLLKEDLSNKLNDLRIKDKTVLNSTKVALMSKILDSFSHQWQVPISKISFELQNLQKLEDSNLEKDKLNTIKNNIEIELKELSNMLNETKIIFTKRDITSSNLFEVVKDIVADIKYEDIEIKVDIDEELEVNIANNELKKIINNIISTIVEQTKIYSIEKTTIKITIDDEKNSEEIVLKIEENIKDLRKKAYLDNILRFDDEKYYDTQLYLAKLLIDKNQAIFWCKNSLEQTIYYIKFKKSRN